jgi:hypothetical protein
MPFHCARGSFTRNEEPTLQELLEEPIVQLFMICDGVEEGELRRLMKAAARVRLVADVPV